MGRIKTKKIKRNTRMIFKKDSEELSGDFEANKKVIASKYSIASKKLRNIIAGYCTRLKKSEN
ncbi:30S ribosomal protein S17e [Candidatus Woesearchaeota archaeon]|nr:30S ribosomal protein S17e [Candidatus Woesearchaeota archaeon]